MNYLIFSFFNSAHQFQNLHNAIIIRVPTSQTGTIFTITVQASTTSSLFRLGTTTSPRVPTTSAWCPITFWTTTISQNSWNHKPLSVSAAFFHLFMSNFFSARLSFSDFRPVLHPNRLQRSDVRSKSGNVYAIEIEELPFIGCFAAKSISNS